MPDLNKRLRKAAAAGGLFAVRTLLKKGADVHSNNDFALRVAALGGHLAVVRCLIAAGADVTADDNHAVTWAALNGYTDVLQCLLAAGAGMPADFGEVLRAAARNGNAEVVRLFRAHGESAVLLLPSIQTYDHSVQTAIVAAGEVGELAVPDLARQGACPEALCVLLGRQGQSDLAAMLTATQMLEPMDQDARAEMLADLLAKQPAQEIHHAGP